jgi:hypothetical protein
VTGVVLDPEGHPAPGSTVTCEGGAPVPTDDQGRFQLGEGVAGCSAIARHPQLVASEPVVLAAGRTNTLRLRRGGAIEGEVVDERGAPVAAYLLAVESYRGSATEGVPTGPVKGIQDPRGAFAWDGLPPGGYVLTASAEGRPPARSPFVDVDAGRTTAHVRITLARGAKLTGRVLDAVTHRPVAFAVVALDALTTTQAQAVRPVQCDDQGAYALDGAPPGPFSIRVTHKMFRARVVTGLYTRGASTVQQDIEIYPLVDGGPTGDDFAGIGAFIGPSPGGVTFTGLRADGPAAQAGVQAGDLLRRIDGADVSNVGVAECMQNLRGPEGSRVTVEVERGGRRLSVTIQRRAFTL